VNAWSIDQNDLPRRSLPFLGDVDDALNAVTRRLRLARNDGKFLAHHGIQESGFAGIGTADDRYKS